MPRRRPRYSRQAVQNAILAPTLELTAARLEFEAHLLAIPAVPYEVDPTLHAQKLQEHVLQGLVKHFPPERAKPKKTDAITEYTFALVRAKSASQKTVSISAR